MVVSAPTYAELAVTEAGRFLELHDGIIVEKPPMSIGRNRSLRKLDRLLQRQLDHAEYEVSVNASRVFRPDESYYIPDLMVIPTGAIEDPGDRLDILEVYASPLPLIVEISSPSTGSYDIDEKLPRYQERGDWEIWRIDPFQRTLTAWRRQADGSYLKTVHTDGTLSPIALPGVTIEITELFDA